MGPLYFKQIHVKMQRTVFHHNGFVWMHNNILSNNDEGDTHSNSFNQYQKKYCLQLFIEFRDHTKAVVELKHVFVWVVTVKISVNWKYVIGFIM